MDINGVNLNLLSVLKLLLTHRHVSKTAEALGTSQSTVSRSLANLREVFDDPLLVKHAEGYRLSPRAKEIQPQLDKLFNQIEHLLQPPDFQASTCTKKLRFFGLAPQVSSVMPKFISRLRELAPLVSLDIDSNPQDHFTALNQGDVHFVLSSWQPQYGDNNLYCLPLVRQDFCLLMSEDNPLAQTEITLEEFKKANFAAMAINELEQFFPEMRLREYNELMANENLNIVVRLNSFAPVANLAESTDLVFHLPRSFAEELEQSRNLIIRDIPGMAKTESKVIHLYWHHHFHNDELCKWVRQQFRELYPFNRPM